MGEWRWRCTRHNILFITQTLLISPLWDLSIAWVFIPPRWVPLLGASKTYKFPTTVSTYLRFPFNSVQLSLNIYTPGGILRGPSPPCMRYLDTYLLFTKRNLYVPRHQTKTRVRKGKVSEAPYIVRTYSLVAGYLLHDRHLRAASWSRAL